MRSKKRRFKRWKTFKNEWVCAAWKARMFGFDFMVYNRGIYYRCRKCGGEWPMRIRLWHNCNH